VIKPPAIVAPAPDVLPASGVAVRPISHRRVALERDGATICYLRPALVAAWLFRAESAAIEAALDRAHRLETARRYLEARAARAVRQP
jgi:hypothetical protein